MALIRLEGMSFYAYHGCFDAEQVVGTRFRVDMTLSVDTSAAERSDNLDDTVNYFDVFQLVKREMAEPSHLLEHVARRVGGAVLAAYQQVQSLTVKVSKLNPPLGGDIDAVSVELEMLRNC